MGGRKRKHNESTAVDLPIAHEHEEMDIDNDASDDLWERIRKGYADDVWFTKEANTRPFVKRDGLWWRENQIVVPNSSNLRVHDARGARLPIQRTLRIGAHE